MIYFISDTHFNDLSVIRFIPQTVLTFAGCRSIWSYQAIRDVIDNITIERWKDTIQPDDILYHLGDVGKFNTVDEARELINKLPGHKYLIMGNHDSDPTYIGEQSSYIEYWMQAGFENVYDKTIKLDDFITLQHKPPEFLNYPDFIMFGHIHSTFLYRTVTPRSYCVCAERNNFTPVQFDRINLLRKLEERKMMSDQIMNNDIYLDDFIDHSSYYNKLRGE